MSEAAVLARECAVFTRYLVGGEPAPATRAAYVRAHARAEPLGVSADRRERSLLALARRGPARARAADSFARVFSPAGLLRRKLVCLLAILETGAETGERLDTADEPHRAVFFARMGLGAFGFALRVVAVALWLPLSGAVGGRG